MNILVLNAGSATLKFGLYRNDPKHTSEQTLALECLARGVVERVGSPQAHRKWSVPANMAEQPVAGNSMGEATVATIEAIQSVSDLLDPEGQKRVPIDAVGCRIVHGGAHFRQAVRVDAAVLGEIQALCILAPLHNPVGATVMETVRHCLPAAPVVAVFDTAFHSGLPPEASTYALPHALCERLQLRRYGFHGISHRYVSERLLECMGRVPQGTRLIVCHLGNGASVCAVRDGQSVDISMGLTPLEGLVMGTRSGDIDPGLVLHLLHTAGMSPEAVEHLLNRESGLLGLSGVSADMRDVERAAFEGNAQAELALEVFAYRVCKYIGAYAAALSGVDAVAFTGGIGEHSPPMRDRICQRLGFLGLHLDRDSNFAAMGNTATRISTDASTVTAWVIPTDEEQQIARETFMLLS